METILAPDRAFEDTGLLSSGAARLPIIRVRRPQPLMGGKCVAITSKGVYVFEECPGTLITIACTHAGSGVLLAADVVPDQNGHFETFSPDPMDPTQDLTRPGLELLHCHPAAMGSWMLNGGFNYGLTIVFGAGHASVPTVASVVWLPYVKRNK